MDKKSFLEESAKYYDASKDYDSIMAHFDIREMKRFFAGRTFLELGSSAGTITKKLLFFCDSLDILEGSVLAINRTKKELNGESKVSYYDTLWEDFVPIRKYTDIVFVRGLEHIQNQSVFIKKISKWLLPGGRIHIIVPNAFSIHKILLSFFGKVNNIFKLSERDKKLGHKIIYDKTTLVFQVKKAQCMVLSVKTFFFKPFKNDVMKKISLNINNPFHKILYVLGNLFPEYDAQIYLVCTPKHSAEI